MNFVRCALLAWLIVPIGLANAETPPDYASFVCWKYPQLPQLRAWHESERIIATALAESYPALRTIEREQNGTPAQLKAFLARLPATDSLTIVYLAAHQSPAGQWYFPNSSVASWGALATDLPKLPNAHRVVMLDCCYARSAMLWPAWSAKVAPAALFASPANELTPDLLVFHRRPVDCDVLFPKAIAWLRQHSFTDSEERVSFFGVAWLQSWLDRATPPRDLGQWKNFSEDMAASTHRVASSINVDDGSEISFTFPPADDRCGSKPHDN